MTANCDIAIIGGGPVGAALALALRDSEYMITVLEARKPAETNTDPRALALSYGSRLTLTQLGVWSHLNQVSAIKTIHISQKHAFGRSVLRAADLKVPELGYVLPYQVLHHELHKQLTNSPVAFRQDAVVTHLENISGETVITFRHEGKEQKLHARLVVIADGGKLLEASHPAEIHDYGQTAIIAHVNCSEPKTDTAFERFTKQGPVALLPYQQGYELVWTVPSTDVESILQMDNVTFLAQLHQHFGDRVGHFVSAGPRSSFPLRLKRAPVTTLPHTALIGNAAQTLHPVAGQGFNMGLRDAWELAHEILHCSNDSLGTPAMLEKYSSSRSLDRNAGIRFTDGLVRLFSNNLPVIGSTRAASLSVLDCLPGVKKFVARRMMFGTNG